MELMEISEQRRMSREEAARELRKLADSLARHNSLDMVRGGVRVNVKVPDEVTLEFEVEIESESGESSIEVEISW